MISRDEICKELEVDSNTLEQYLAFIAHPNPLISSIEPNLVAALYKLNDLVKIGYSFADIKSLINCSEKFSNHIPELRDFLLLSETINLRETLSGYQNAFQEISLREEQYQTRIQELETDIRSLRSQLETAGILEEQVTVYQNEFSNIQSQVNEKDLYIENLEMRVSELEIKNSNMKYELDNSLDELEGIKSNLGEGNSKPKTAIDIGALLKKKEKEISLKYQREILNLKKQVEVMMESQEEKWLKRNFNSKVSS